MAWLVACPLVAWAGQKSNPFTGKPDYCATIVEEDGSPSATACQTVEVPNGALTDDGDGNFSLSTSGTGAPTDAEYIVGEANGSLSAEVDPSAANQVPNSSSSTAAAWTASPTLTDVTATATMTGTVLSATGALQVGADYIQDITGTGLSISGGRLNASGSGNSFETVAVPAGTNPVADNANDTLTITETSFLTLTGTAASDTIDITQVTTDLGTDGLIAANAVALGTDTTNAYVATVADAGNSTITVVGSGGETAAITLDAIDLNCTNCIGDTEVSTHAGTSLAADLEEEGQINATAVTGNVADTQLLIGTGASTASWATMGTDATISNIGALTIAANAVALGTDTTNNYVATIADAGNSNITVANSGTESAAITLNVVDVTCTGCLGTTEIAGLDISADTNLTAGDNLTLTDDDLDLDASITLTNVTASSTVTGTVLSATGAVQVGSDYVSDMTGSGLSVVNGALTAAGGSSHTMLSATHTDTSAASATRGDLIVANSSPAWARFAVGGSNTVLTANGTDPGWSATPTVTSLTATNTVTGTVAVDTVFIDNTSSSQGGVVMVRDSVSSSNTVTGTSVVDSPLLESGAGATIRVRDALNLVGNSDTVQLTVKGFATQTSNLLNATNNANTSQLTLTNAGNLTANGTGTFGGTAQSTITEGVVVNSGSGTDEDDDFTVNATGGTYEVDAGGGTFIGTTNDAGWTAVDGTDNTAGTSQCTSACLFGVQNATGTAVTGIVSCSDTTADTAVCMGPN